MSDYISREAVLEKAEYDGNYRLIVPAEVIKGLPAADVEPVRRGVWVAQDRNRLRKGIRHADDL